MLPSSSTKSQQSTIAAVAGVAGVAAWVSYVHGYTVAVRYGVPAHSIEAYAYPCLVDGPMYVASKVLYEDARRTRRPADRKERRLRIGLARGMLAAGIGFTLFVNVLSGISHGPLGAVLMAWPAVAVAVSFELLMCLIRASAEPAAAVPAPARTQVPVPVPVPAAVPAPRSEAGTAGQVRGGNDCDLTDKLSQAERLFADHIQAGTVPPFREVRSMCKVGDDVARKIREHIASRHQHSCPLVPQAA